MTLLDSRVRVRLQGSSSSPYAPSTGAHVLLVDDDPALRRGLVLMLHRLGYRTTDVASAEEALTWLQSPEAVVDVLVTDVVMAGASGFELAHRVRLMRPDLPVVLCTGRGSLGGGADDPFRGEILRKPFTTLELAERLSRALRRAPR